MWSELFHNDEESEVEYSKYKDKYGYYHHKFAYRKSDKFYRNRYLNGENGIKEHDYRVYKLTDIIKLD